MVSWGEPYGYAWYTPRGRRLVMYRKGQRVRFYDERGRQVGPEQRNAGPAIAYAMQQGWVDEGPQPEFRRGLRRNLRGGLSEGVPLSSFDQRELRRGTKVEMEHTSDRKVAQRIAADHLMEDARYYDKLERCVEKDMQHRPNAATAKSRAMTEVTKTGDPWQCNYDAKWGELSCLLESKDPYDDASVSVTFSDLPDLLKGHQGSVWPDAHVHFALGADYEGHFGVKSWNEDVRSFADVGRILNKAAKLIHDHDEREAAEMRRLGYEPNVGNERNDAQRMLYDEWRDLVNMGPAELERYASSSEGREAGLSRRQAAAEGIRSGRESARAIMRMKRKPKSEWTARDWDWARRQVSFIKRMRGTRGPLRDKQGEPTRKLMALKIWGHNPEKGSYTSNVRGAGAYWVWLVQPGTNQPMISDGPHGPHDLQGAKTFARIGATEGAHDRAVSKGRDPEARGFEIVRVYRAGTGERAV